MSWLSRLLRRSPFTPLEQRLLQELQSRLSPEAATLLAEQVRAINLAQRHAGGREVCFYPMRRGRPERNEAVRFPARQPELKLATVQLEVPGQGRTNAEFHLVEGYFFSIEFTPSAAKSASGDVHVQRVTIHHNPMIPVAGAVARTEIEAELPEDYGAAQALATEGVRVLSKEGVYSVVLEDATYYVLAQVEDWGVLGIRRYSDDGMIYLLPFDGPPKPLGKSLRQAVALSAGQAPAHS